MQIRILFLLLNFPILTGYAQQYNWEYSLLRSIEGCRTYNGIRFYQTYSDMNNLFCISVPVSIAAGGLISRNNTTLKYALFISESIAISTLITQATKKITNRKRPGMNDSTLSPVLNLTSNSFPSGHTSIAFSMATALTIICPKWYIWIPAFSYATLMAYSRIYLGVHYPTDLIAGAFIGSGSSWLSYRLNRWMHKNKNNVLKRTF